MRYLSRSAALAAVLILIAGCSFGQKARDHTLLPALRLASHDIERDANNGVASLPEAEQPAAQAQVAAFFAALRADPPGEDARLLWATVAGLCEQGFKARLASGAIGPNVAGELREQVAQFGAGISAYYREES